MWRCRLEFMLMPFLVSYFGTMTPAVGESPVLFNGHWWLLLTQEERSGYINGDEDCYRFELDKIILPSKSADEISEFVTNFYRNNIGNINESAFSVIRRADIKMGNVAELKGGEVWKDRHGYWNGDWWRQGQPADRLGFVEGYLSCLRSIEDKGKQFPNDPPAYVTFINRWYGLNQETGDVNPQREEAKIGDVLVGFGAK